MTAIIPSSLFEERESNNFDLGAFSHGNNKLRLGMVLKIHEIEDDTNLTQLGPEYDVVAVQDGTNYGLNTAIYERCLRFDSFGGVADFFQTKLRQAKEPEKLKENVNFSKEVGSVVLLLCLDGESERAIIIGSLSNPSKKLLNKELGHHMEGEFNGINWKVNKDGELTVTFKAATKDDGKPVNEEDAKKTAGTFFKIDKTGSAELQISEKEFLKIDKTEKTITVNAEKDIKITTEANANITAKANIQLTGKDIIASAEGKISFQAKSPSAFKIDAALEIKAAKMNIESDGPFNVKAGKIQMKGDMVEIQADMVNVKATTIMLGAGGTPAVTSATTFGGVGNLGLPIFVNALGPYSSSVLVGS